MEKTPFLSILVHFKTKNTSCHGSPRLPKKTWNDLSSEFCSKFFSAHFRRFAVTSKKISIIFAKMSEINNLLQKSTVFCIQLAILAPLDASQNYHIFVDLSPF
jgi:hypothetical protein